MTQGIKLITKIAVAPDLWGTNVLPEGLIERWLLADGTFVKAGDPVAMVRIEDALHELVAPARGQLSIGSKPNSVVEPGMTIGKFIRQLPTA